MTPAALREPVAWAIAGAPRIARITAPRARGRDDRVRRDRQPVAAEREHRDHPERGPRHAGAGIREIRGGDGGRDEPEGKRSTGPRFVVRAPSQPKSRRHRAPRGDRVPVAERVAEAVEAQSARHRVGRETPTGRDGFRARAPRRAAHRTPGRRPPGARCARRARSRAARPTRDSRAREPPRRSCVPSSPTRSGSPLSRSRTRAEAMRTPAPPATGDGGAVIRRRSRRRSSTRSRCRTR